MHPTPDTHSARYFALLYSSAPEHPVLESLFGIEREMLDSLRPGIDHHVAHSRLQWWREECERTAGGTPVHPLTRALVTALGGTSTAQSKLLGLSGFVDVAVWDLASATFETRRELTAYCERWATAMINPLVALGGGLATPGTSWLAVGAAMREIEMLADVAREAHRGRLRIPLDELRSVEAEPSTLAKPPWPAAVTNLLRARHKALRDEIARTLGNVDREQQPMLRGLLVWAALVSRSSRRVERALPERFDPGRFGAISDAFFSWRIARSATVGRFEPR
jgi:15-cis-phytoene synthase